MVWLCIKSCDRKFDYTHDADPTVGELVQSLRSPTVWSSRKIRSLCIKPCGRTRGRRREFWSVRAPAPLGWYVWLSLGKPASPRTVARFTAPNLVTVGRTAESTWGIHPKFCHFFKRGSRPSEVTWFDWELPNYGPILYSFQDKRRHWWKKGRFFVLHMYLTPRLQSHRRYCALFNAVSIQKTRIVDLQGRGKVFSHNYVIHSDRRKADRRADRRTDSSLLRCASLCWGTQNLRSPTTIHTTIFRHRARDMILNPKGQRSKVKVAGLAWVSVSAVPVCLINSKQLCCFQL